MSKHLKVRTPEGLDLEIELAPMARRVGAFLVDLAIIYFFLFAMLIATLFISSISDDWAIAGFILGSFLFRNFYFATLEILWSGRTVGKRVLGLRVVDAKGKPLKPTALFLRNVTRDPEMFLPLIAVFSPEVLMPGAPWWMHFVALGWVFIFALFPFINRNRARTGDMIAGTVVALVPTPELLDDLAEAAPSRVIRFSPQQLDMYGIYELQTLESVIRAELNYFEQERIAGVIANKINFDSKRIGDPKSFLDSFYHALRERLEHRMVLGDRQEKKVEGRLEQP